MNTTRLRRSLGVLVTLGALAEGALGAPTPPVPDGPVLAGARLEAGDWQGPLDLPTLSVRRGSPANGSASLAIAFPQPVRLRDFQLELEGPEGSEVGVLEHVVRRNGFFGRFAAHHDDFAAITSATPNPYGGGHRITDIPYAGSAVGSVYHQPADVGLSVAPAGTVARTVTIFGSAPYGRLSIDDIRQPTPYPTLDLGEPEVQAIVLRVNVRVPDARELDGQGVQVAVRSQGQLLGYHTVLAIAGSGFAHSEELTARGTGSGAQVQLGDGELAYGLPLFAAEGPGVPVALGLSYRSFSAGYWRALAGRPDRDEFLWAPFGPGWSSAYGLRVLIERYDDRTGSNQRRYRLQSSTGRVFETWVFQGKIRYPSSAELSPLFGVPFDALRLELGAGPGFVLGAPASPLVAEFDGEGRLLRLRRRDHGRALRLEYTPAAITIRDSQERVTSWELDGEGRVVKIVDPAQETWILKYSGAHLVQVRHQSTTLAYSFAYGAHHQLVSLTRPGGSTMAVSYRARGQGQGHHRTHLLAHCVSRVAEGPEWRSFAWTGLSNGFRVRVADAAGRSQLHQLEGGNAQNWLFEQGRLKTLRRLNGGHRVTRFTTYARDVVPPATTNERVTSWVHDAAGRTTQRRDPDGRAEYWNYAADAFVPHEHRDRAARVTSYVTTSAPGLEGLLSELRQPPASPGDPPHTTHYTYDGAGQLRSVEAPGRPRVVFLRSNDPGYEGLVTEQQEQDASGLILRSERFAYDALGRLVRHEDPEGRVTARSYDGLQRLVRVDHPDGTHTAYRYGPDGLVSEVDQPTGGTLVLQRDAQGRVVSEALGGQAPTRYELNALGEVERVTPPGGAATTVTYTPEGWVEGVTDQALGVHYRYDPDGLVREVEEGAVNEDTRTTVFHYDVLGRVVRRELPGVVGLSNGQKWRPTEETEYSPTGLVTRVLRELLPQQKEETRTLHDGLDRLRALVRGAPGGPYLCEEFDYDPAGRFLRRRGIEEVAGLPSLAQVVARAQAPPPPSTSADRRRGGEGRVYDDLGRPCQILDALGRITAELDWNLADQLTELRRPDSSGVLETVERRGYDADSGQLTEIQDGQRPATYVSWGSQGLPAKVKDPEGGQVRVTRDAFGRPQRIERVGSDGTTVAVERRYTAAGQLERETQLNGGKRQTTRYGYDARGRLTSVTNPLGQVTTLVYDSRDQLVERQTPEGTIRYQYDALGRRIGSSEPGRGITTQVDLAGRPVREEGPRFLREIQRDANGRPTEIRVSDAARGLTKRLELAYDGFGQLERVRDAEGVETRYRYTSQDRLAAVTRDGDLLASFAYDLQGRLVRQEFPGIGVQTRVLDGRGRVACLEGTGAAGHEIVYGYDVAGRQESADYRHLGLIARFAYDGAGRLVSETVADAQGRVVHQESQAYDGAGNRVRHTVNEITQVFRYDAFNQLEEQVRYEAIPVALASLQALADSQSDLDHAPALAVDGAEPLSSGPGEAFLSAPTDADHWLEVRVARGPQGIPQAIGAFELTLPTDHGLPRRLELEHLDPNTQQWTPVRVLAVTGARLLPPPGGGSGGHQIEPQRARIVVSFLPVESDGLRVLQPRGQGPALPASNPAQALTLAVSELRPLAIDPQPTGFVHDGNGNLVQAGTAHYAYDLSGHLLSVSEPGLADVEYAYGPDGRLWAEWDRRRGEERLQLYLGGQVYAEYAPSGEPVAKHLLGPSLDRKLGVVPFEGGVAQETRFFFATAQGSVHQVFTADELLETRFQSAWGQSLQLDVLESAPETTVRAGYTGRPTLLGTGLVNSRARAYSPQLGRFLSPDPAGTLDGQNRFAYVGSDPVNRVDPSGLWGEHLFGKGQHESTAAAWLGGLLDGFFLDPLRSLEAKTQSYASLLRARGDSRVGVALGAVSMVALDSIGVTRLYDASTATDMEHFFATGTQRRQRGYQRVGQAVVGSLELVTSLAGVGAIRGALRVGPPRVPPRGCFLAGTLVETREGKRAIEDVAVGDEVLSRNNVTGEQGYKRVVRLFRGHTDQVVYLRIAKAPATQRGRSERHRVGEASGGDDAEEGSDLADDAQTLRCTTEHPFWVVGRGWVTSGKLKVGDRLVGSKGEALVVVGHEIRAEQADHFNFHVEGWNTYFVAERESDPFVWVHNKGESFRLTAAASREAEQLVSIYGRRTSGATHDAIVQGARGMGFQGEVVVLRGAGSGRVGAGLTSSGEMIVFEQAYLRGFRAEGRVLRGNALLAHEVGHVGAPIPHGATGLSRTQSWLREAQASARGGTARGLTPAERAQLVDDMRNATGRYRRAGGTWPGE